jgi:hypothetical protein
MARRRPPAFLVAKTEFSRPDPLTDNHHSFAGLSLNCLVLRNR